MRRGIGSSRRRNKKRALIIIPLFLLCLAAAAGYFISENCVFTAEGVRFSWWGKKNSQMNEDDIPQKPDDVNITTEAPIVTTEKPTEKPTEAMPEPLVRLGAKWVTVENLRSESYVDSLISQGVRQVLFTVKDKDGLFHLPLENDIIDSKNIVANDAEAISNSIKKLKDNDVYIICGISALRDNILARAHRGEAVTTNGETLWLDRDSITWFDPSSQTAANYITDMARALKEAGIDEIMLTNFSYPYIGKTNLIMNKPDEAVLAALAEKITAVDMTVSYVNVIAQDSSVTGQNVELLEKYFDRIMITARPDSAEAKAFAERLADKDKLTYIIDSVSGASENISYIYTK